MTTKRIDIYKDRDIDQKVILKTQRYYILGKITYIFAMVVHTSWLILFSTLNVTNLALFNVFSVLTFILCLYLNKRRQFLSAVSIATIEVLLHQVLAVLLIGWSAGFQYYLFSLIFLPFLTDKKNLPLKFFLSISIIVTYMILEHYYSSATPIYVVKSAATLILNKMNILFSLALICIWAYYFNNSVNAAEDAFEREQLKAENLLHNILPNTIAEKLKAGNQNIADGFENVTVLFLDIVGFTPLSAQKTPGELVEILNKIFSQFDDLCGEYQLEKIKTIGDSYMVASGIPEYSADHAIKMAEFSLKLQEVLNNVNKEMKTELKIRTGINSGPVVAGVIGKKKFIYDLWGDAVNTASRMESHSPVGKIQVSHSSYLLLKEHFNFTENEEKEIKGKGLMKTYILEGKLH